MKHGKHMSNIEMVKKMQAGERPFLQIGYTGNEKYIIRKVGETWTDKNGKQWIEKENGPQSITSVIDIVRQETNDKCTECGYEIRWGTKLDKKMYYRTRKCFDCLVKEETILRAKGKYKLYELKKVLENTLASLNDTKKMLRESNDYVKAHKVFTFVNSNGFVEEWKNDSRDDVLRNIKHDFVGCLKEIKRIEKELKQVNNEIGSVLKSK